MEPGEIVTLREFLSEIGFVPKWKAPARGLMPPAAKKDTSADGAARDLEKSVARGYVRARIIYSARESSQRVTRNKINNSV